FFSSRYHRYMVSSVTTLVLSDSLSFFTTWYSLTAFNSSLIHLKMSLVILKQLWYIFVSYLGGMKTRLTTSEQNTPIITSENLMTAASRNSNVVVSPISWGASMMAIIVTTASVETLCRLKNSRTASTNMTVSPMMMMLLPNKRTITIADIAPRVFPWNCSHSLFAERCTFG